jgi:hypothetical protein
MPLGCADEPAFTCLDGREESVQFMSHACRQQLYEWAIKYGFRKPALNSIVNNYSVQRSTELYRFSWNFSPLPWQSAHFVGVGR